MDKPHTDDNIEIKVISKDYQYVPNHTYVHVIKPDKSIKLRL